MNLPEQIKQLEESKTHPTIIEKQLSDIEKAREFVTNWTEKIAYHEKELHFAKKNLKVHQHALKSLIQLENEMNEVQ